LVAQPNSVDGSTAIHAAGALAPAAVVRVVAGVRTAAVARNQGGGAGQRASAPAADFPDIAVASALTAVARVRVEVHTQPIAGVWVRTDVALARPLHALAAETGCGLAVHARVGARAGPTACVGVRGSVHAAAVARIRRRSSAVEHALATGAQEAIWADLVARAAMGVVRFGVHAFVVADGQSRLASELAGARRAHAARPTPHAAEAAVLVVREQVDALSGALR